MRLEVKIAIILLLGIIGHIVIILIKIIILVIILLYCRYNNRIKKVMFNNSYSSCKLIQAILILISSSNSLW